SPWRRRPRKPNQSRAGICPRWWAGRGTATRIWSERMAAEARTVLAPLAQPHLPLAHRLRAIHLLVILTAPPCAGGRTPAIRPPAPPVPAAGIARLRRLLSGGLTRTGRIWLMANRA